MHISFLKDFNYSEKFTSIQVGGWPTCWQLGHTIYFDLVAIYVMCLFPACPMKRLKGCTDGRTSTAWDYASLLCNYRDAGLKRCHHSQTSRVQFPLNPIYICCNCNMLLTGLHHSPPLPLKFIITPPSAPASPSLPYLHES